METLNSSNVLLCLVVMACCDCAEANGPAATAAERQSEAETAVYEVHLADPVFASEPARVHRVVETRDERGFPLGYALSIQTPVCIDRKCRIVDVIMHWNALGYYERLECPPGKPLTKKEHEPFTPQDYVKLDGILKQSNSILADHSLAFLVERVEDDTQIDAWTGATPATVQASVVKDAAFTTWAMWRWANGEITHKLRSLTEAQCTGQYLRLALRSEDRRFVDFALNYVIEHYPSDPQFLESVFHVLENGDREQVSLSLKFLGGAMQDRRRLHARLIESCCRMSSAYSPMILKMFAAEAELPATTLEGLTGRLDQLPYFQVHLILRMLETRKFFSKKTESDVAKLLQSNNFFIARRACEHLMKQDLDQPAQSKVDAFRRQHRDR